MLEPGDHRAIFYESFNPQSPNQPINQAICWYSIDKMIGWLLDWMIQRRLHKSTAWNWKIHRAGPLSAMCEDEPRSLALELEFRREKCSFSSERKSRRDRRHGQFDLIEAVATNVPFTIPLLFVILFSTFQISALLNFSSFSACPLVLSRGRLSENGAEELSFMTVLFSFLSAQPTSFFSLTALLLFFICSTVCQFRCQPSCSLSSSSILKSSIFFLTSSPDWLTFPIDWLGSLQVSKHSNWWGGPSLAPFPTCQGAHYCPPINQRAFFVFALRTQTDNGAARVAAHFSCDNSFVKITCASRYSRFGRTIGAGQPAPLPAPTPPQPSVTKPPNLQSKLAELCRRKVQEWACGNDDSSSSLF